MPAHGPVGGPTDPGTGDGGTQEQPTLPPPPVDSDSTVGGDIHVDPAGIRAGARMFGSTAGYAQGIESRFLGGTAGLHGVWGNDETGKNFEKSYTQRIQGATDALKAIREGLTALPESVDGWAQSYEQANEDNAAIADGLSRQMQDGA